MGAVAERLTLAEFEARYGREAQRYEYWYGQAIAKAVPTWIHSRLQIIIGWLLAEAGYYTGGDTELRVVPEARPRPDVVASLEEIKGPYPTHAADVAVEILSPDDSASYLLEKCQAYAAWGFEYIYVVDPENRQLFRWKESVLARVDALTTIPAERIWQELDKKPRR